MPYVRYSLTGGLVTKADPTALADGQLQVAIGCGYETAGAVTSARGRLVLNDGVALAGDGDDQDIRGHFDAFGDRYTKSGTSVYKNYDESFVGATGDWDGSTHITGFGYGQYVYLCGGGRTARVTDADPTTLQTWGLVAPGYQELGTDPLSTTTTAIVTVTTPEAHGFSTNMVVEIIGATMTNGIPAERLNGRKIITVTGTYTYTFDCGANGTAAGITGGGSAIIQKQAIGTALVIVPGAGGSVPVGTVQYAYTFYNGMAESNFSSMTKCTTTGGNQAPQLVNLLPGPTGTTEIRIYRTDVAGSQLYYLASIPMTGATGYSYVDLSEKPPGMDQYATAGDAVNDDANPGGSSDEIRKLRIRAEWRSKLFRNNPSKNLVAQEVVATNLGYLASWTNHDAPPDDLEGVIIVNDQVVGISGNEVRFSAVGNPEHWPIENRIIPGKSDGETLLCVKAFDRDVIIYTDSGLYRLTQLGTSFEDSRFEAIESPVGTTGKHAVAVLDGQQGHVFLSDTGLYLFDGQRVQEASLAFDTLFDQHALETYSVNATYNETAILEALRDRVFMSYGANAANDTMLLINYENVSDPKATLLTRSVTTLVRERASNKLIAGDSAGRLYECDYGHADEYYVDAAGETHQSPVFMLLATKDFQLAGGGAFALDEVTLEGEFGVDAGESQPTLTVEVRARETTHIATFDVASTTRSRLKFKCPQYLKGEAVRCTYYSNSVFEQKLAYIGFTYRPFQEEP